jgi:hypothetical protein
VGGASTFFGTESWIVMDCECNYTLSMYFGGISPNSSFFLGMIKKFKNYLPSMENNIFEKENEEFLGIFHWNLQIYLFIYLFDRHVLKPPLYYYGYSIM